MPIGLFLPVLRHCKDDLDGDVKSRRHVRNHKRDDNNDDHDCCFSFIFAQTGRLLEALHLEPIKIELMNENAVEKDQCNERNRDDQKGE